MKQESNRQKTMEDIDGGLHAAVDGQSLDDDDDDDGDDDDDDPTVRWLIKVNRAVFLLAALQLCVQRGVREPCSYPFVLEYGAPLEDRLHCLLVLKHETPLEDRLHCLLVLKHRAPLEDRLHCLLVLKHGAPLEDRLHCLLVL